MAVCMGNFQIPQIPEYWVPTHRSPALLFNPTVQDTGGPPGSAPLNIWETGIFCLLPSVVFSPTVGSSTLNMPAIWES